MIKSKKNTLRKAVLINASSKYLNILLNILVNAILARLVSPEDYGLMAIVTVFSTLFSTIADMGLSTAVVQDKELTDRDMNSIFSFSIYISFFLGIMFALLSFAIAHFYNEKILIKLGQLLSVSLLFSSMSAVPNGKLNRDKRFLEMSIRNIVIYISSALVAILFAFRGAGIYSLIIQSILSAVFMFVWSEGLTGLRFNLTFSMDSVRRIASYSGFQYAFSLSNYFARNLDNILIGKYMGATQLAFYARSYNLMLYPINNITGVVTPVLHPILSDFQENREYIYVQYVKILKILALIAILVEGCCFFFAKEIIYVFYGKNWDASIICFQILSLAICTQMLTGTTGGVFQSLGETKLLFIAGSINIFITVCGMIVGLVIGNTIEYVALFVSIAYVFHFFVSFYIMMKYGFKRSYVHFLMEFWKEITIFAIMFICGVLYERIVNVNDNMIIGKMVLILTVYLGGVFLSKEHKVLTVLFHR